MMLLIVALLHGVTSQIIGSIEPNNTAIYGWACDPSNPGQLSLSVYAGSVFLGSATTGVLTRTDAAPNCLGNAAIGYLFPWYLVPVNMNYDQQPNINTLTITETTTSTQIATPLVYDWSTIGAFDVLDANIGAGWLCDRDAPGPQAVHVYAGGPAGVGKFVIATTSNGERPDLVTALWPQSWCKCTAASCVRGFSFSTAAMRANLIMNGFTGSVAFYAHLIQLPSGSPNWVIGGSPKIFDVSALVAPTSAPTPQPTLSPTPSPTPFPTPAPTKSPTPAPTNSPTPAPTNAPTPLPPMATLAPTPSPTNAPTPAPTAAKQTGSVSSQQQATTTKSITSMMKTSSPSTTKEETTAVTSPNDCLLSAWSMWSMCTVTCDRGTRSRTRTMQRAALSSGMCFALSDTEACPNNPSCNGATSDTGGGSSSAMSETSQSDGDTTSMDEQQRSSSRANVGGGLSQTDLIIIICAVIVLLIAVLIFVLIIVRRRRSQQQNASSSQDPANAVTLIGMMSNPIVMPGGGVANAYQSVQDVPKSYSSVHDVPKSYGEVPKSYNEVPKSYGNLTLVDGGPNNFYQGLAPLNNNNNNNNFNNFNNNNNNNVNIGPSYQAYDNNSNRFVNNNNAMMMNNNNNNNNQFANPAMSASFGGSMYSASQSDSYSTIPIRPANKF